MDIYIWLSFAAAVFGLAITPGPNGLLALNHGLIHGYRQACYTIIGSVAGFLVLFGISIAGLGLLLQSSPVMLTLCKVAGSLYLIWLGVQLWRKPFSGIEEEDDTRTIQKRQLFQQGMMVALSNPKVILFLGVFLALFIDPDRPLALQFSVMAGTFAATEFIVQLVVAIAAFHARPWLARNGQQFNRLCGSLFILLAILLPLAQ